MASDVPVHAQGKRQGFVFGLGPFCDLEKYEPEFAAYLEWVFLLSCEKN